ncbi:MAG: hypothetical protein IJN90_07760 [Bacilli bacterium]|nr:hypothetical protein [Bacilli bacterium]
MDERKRYERRVRERELGYRFGTNNFYFSIFVLIICFIFSIRPLIDAESKAEFFNVILVNLFVFAPFFIFNLIEIWFYKRNINIKKHGVRVDGFISDIGCKVADNQRKSLKYYLFVEYNDPASGKLITYKTPILNFNPIFKIGSKVCSVYIYKNKVFVSDFVPNEGTPLWHIEDLPHLSQPSLKRKFIISNLLDILSPVIMGGIVLIIFYILRFLNII